MKIPTLLLIAAALLGALSAQAKDLPFKEPFSQTHAFDANGALRLENVNGQVEVRAWDRNEILIEGEKSAATEEALKHIELEINVSNEKADIRVHLPKRSGFWASKGANSGVVTFRISVPATAQIAKIDSVNGNILLEGLRGSVTAATVNGRITSHSLAGDVRLNSVNGTISAQFGQVAKGQSVSLDTVNGGVVVEVPKDAGFSVHCSVVNGRINCGVPITLQGTGRHDLNGTIGDGRASLRAATVNGHIRIDGGKS